MHYFLTFKDELLHLIDKIHFILSVNWQSL